MKKQLTVNKMMIVSTYLSVGFLIDTDDHSDDSDNSDDIDDGNESDLVGNCPTWQFNACIKG